MILQVKNISEYYRLAGLGKPRHPLISIYQFKDMPRLELDAPVRFTLGFYVVTIKYQCDCKSVYGQTNYDYDEGVMGFTAPNQLLGVEPDQYMPAHGWCLNFHPDLLLHTELAKKIKTYEYFFYKVNEALILSEDEERDIEELFQKIKKELDRPIDKFSQEVLVAQLDLLLTYSNRFYNRQFITRKTLSSDVLTRFEALLDAHVRNEHGLPSVKYLAAQLNISAKYLGDMLKQLTGLSAQQHIHEKLVEIAKEKLSTTSLSVSQIAYELGFEHSQSFSKLFKSKTNQSPLAFRASFTA
jgi:AraC-like DNA-binding protein